MTILITLLDQETHLLAVQAVVLFTLHTRLMYVQRFRFLWLVGALDVGDLDHGVLEKQQYLDYVYGLRLILVKIWYLVLGLAVFIIGMLLPAQAHVG